MAITWHRTWNIKPQVVVSTGTREADPQVAGPHLAIQALAEMRAKAERKAHACGCHSCTRRLQIIEEFLFASCFSEEYPEEYYEIFPEPVEMM